MSCNKFKILLSAYIDGEVTKEEEKKLLEHIKVCPACSREFENLRKIKNLFLLMEQKKPIEFFETRLFARMKERESKSGLQVFGQLVKKLALAFLILFLLILGILNIGRFFHKEPNGSVSTLLTDQKIEDDFDKTLLEIYYGELNLEREV